MSRWYDEELAILEEYRTIQSKSTPKAFLGIGIFFIVCIVAAVTYAKKNPAYNAKASCLVLGVMVVFVFMIAICNLVIGIRKKGIPGLEDELKKILTTPERVAEFDQEMLGYPALQLQGTKEIWFTEHYLVGIFGPIGARTYSFSRLEEIAETRVSTMKDATSFMKSSKVYYIDILDKSGQKITSLTIQKKNNMFEFEDALRKFCPEVKFGQH